MDDFLFSNFINVNKETLKSLLLMFFFFFQDSFLCIKKLQFYLHVKRVCIIFLYLYLLL